MTVLSFILDNKYVLLAYVILAIIVYVNRKKFIVESKILLLYRTKHGVDYINKVADKHKELIKILGYCAIGIGFVGMVYIAFLFLQGLYNLAFVPSAPPTLSLVIPGIQIPGSPIKIPFVYGILALFFVIVFHEFGHGIVARAHGLKIKSTGLGLLGPLPLAFVEPDEKQIVKQPSHIQQSIFAAGPFMNGLLFLIVLLICSFILNPIIMSMLQPQGFTFSSVEKGYPADIYGLKNNTLYTSLDGVAVKSDDDIANVFSCVKPNDTLIIGTGTENISIILASNPKDSSKGFLGVNGVTTKYTLKSNNWFFVTAYNFLLLFSNPNAASFTEFTLLQWVWILSLGIGLANLLPLGPVDGGRMVYTALVDMKGKEKGQKLWGQISIITLAVLLILLLVPILKAVV